MTLIYNAKIVDKNKSVKGSILIDGKKIKSVLTKKETDDFLFESDLNIDLIDAKGMVVLPSFIDMHSHFRDPGFTQKEDLESGINSAIAGGYGAVVLMPNTNPVVSSLELAEKNHQKAKSMGKCRVFQSVSITSDFKGESVEHISNLDSKKVPLITEDGKEVESAAVMLKGMKLAAEKKIIVSCHCEDPKLAAQARELRAESLKSLSQGNKKDAEKFLQEANSLLELAEDTMTVRNIQIAKKAGCHVHICHVSTTGSIEAVRQAKKLGLNVTAEITPHHFSLTGQKAPGIFNIVNPPLRTEDDRQSLLKAIKDGTCDVIATDHAPHTVQDKLNGAPGFPGLETSFAAGYTNLVETKVINLKKLSALMSANPADILGLKNVALIEPGYYANLTIVDLNKTWKVKGEDFASRGKITAFEGKTLKGQVVKTIYEGQIVYSL